MNYERIIINFMEVCNMKCPFCYVPFDGKKIDFYRCKCMIEKCKSLGIKIITFSGGDPFIYSEFRDLLIYAKNLQFETHVDTNGICLNNDDYFLISETSTLLGLPIDGSNTKNHNKMRKFNKHFDIVIKHIKNLKDFKIRLKINTVVTKINFEDTINIFRLVNSLNIDFWSLYQFIPLHDAFLNASSYSLPYYKFESLVNLINSEKYKFNFEPGSANERTGDYLFVSPNGSVYTHDCKDLTKYKFIGSFFDNNWQSKFEKLNTNTIKNKSRLRYNVLNKKI